MIELVLLMAVLWLCRRALVRISLRLVAVVVGFVVGWRLMDRR